MQYFGKKKNAARQYYFDQLWVKFLHAFYGYASVYETHRLPLATVYLPVTSAEQTAATNRASPSFPKGPWNVETAGETDPLVRLLYTCRSSLLRGIPRLRWPKHARISIASEPVQSINLLRTKQRLVTIFQMLDSFFEISEPVNQWRSKNRKRNK